MGVWKTDWDSISNDVDDEPVYCGEERAEPVGLPVDLHSYPHLRTQAPGSELKYWHHQHNQQNSLEIVWEAWSFGKGSK